MRIRADLHPSFKDFPEDLELVRALLKRVAPRDLIKAINEEDSFLDIDLATRKLKSKLRDSEGKYKKLLDKYESLDDLYNDLLNIDSFRAAPNIKPRSKGGSKREATPIVQFSDWHVGESVEVGQVHGLNEYSPEIAAGRAEAVTVNALKLINKERKDIEINTLVLHLGGDWIGGWIHAELEQTNHMSPIEEVLFALDLLKSSLNYFLKYGDFERIVCLCNRGNHGRLTRFMQHANEKQTNLETFIYCSLGKIDGVEVVIPDSDVGYFEIYGRVIRYFHGQQCKYKGGVGGITVPLNKLQARWDETKKAYYNLMGHYHTLSYPNTKTTLNGSLKGFDAYAASKGFAYEPPVQSFQLLDEKYGVTVKAPIFCD